MLKIATWNVNSLKIRLPQVLDFLRIAQPDILALQETKVTNETFPLTDIATAGYQAFYSGQKAYNGVAFLTKKTLQDVVSDIPQLQDPARRILAATYDDVRVINLYIPNGQSIVSEKYQYKLNWLENVTAYLQEQLIQYPKCVVVGDFNIAPEARDVHDPQLWEGSVLFSEPERQAFARFLQLGFKDAFRLFEQTENSFTWWDYRAAAFRRNLGLRIDHILLSTALANDCKVCTIHNDVRKHERPSDHALVMAEIQCA